MTNEQTPRDQRPTNAEMLVALNQAITKWRLLVNDPTSAEEPCALCRIVAHHRLYEYDYPWRPITRACSGCPIPEFDVSLQCDTHGSPYLAWFVSPPELRKDLAITMLNTLLKIREHYFGVTE